MKILSKRKTKSRVAAGYQNGLIGRINLVEKKKVELNADLLIHYKGKELYTHDRVDTNSRDCYSQLVD